VLVRVTREDRYDVKYLHYPLELPSLRGERGGDDSWGSLGEERRGR